MSGKWQAVFFDEGCCGGDDEDIAALSTTEIFGYRGIGACGGGGGIQVCSVPCTGDGRGAVAMVWGMEVRRDEGVGLCFGMHRSPFHSSDG